MSLYPYFDLLEIYAKRPTTIQKLGQYYPTLQKGIQCGNPLSLSSLNIQYQLLHKFLSVEIRTHSFVLDNVYGKQGIHTTTHHILIQNWAGEREYLSERPVTIPLTSTCFEIEKHTYRSHKHAPVELEITLLLQGNLDLYMNPTVKEPESITINHPWVVGWKFHLLNKYQPDDSAVETEHDRIITSLTTI